MPGHKTADDYFARLLEVMDVLRSPEGCPWDREQTRESLKPMLVEEAFEVVEALDGGDPDELCEELGDLLFQVIFHSRISKEKGQFDAGDVCRRLYEKIVGRHPHVFGDESYTNSGELLRHWEDIKAEEKKASGKRHDRRSLLDGIPERLPAVYRSYQISSKAARVGFDWDDIGGIRDKFLEEFEELVEARNRGDREQMRAEVGDLLFAAINIARRLEVDPETALSRANRKFTRRFKAMEEHFRSRGKELRDVTAEEMDTFWEGEKHG